MHDGKPNSKVYHIADKGRDELLSWLRAPAQLAEPKIPWLIQVFFAASLTNEEIIAIFSHIAEKLKQSLSALKEVKKAQITASLGHPSPRDMYFMDLTYDYGLMLHGAVLHWIEGAIEKLQKGEPPQK